MQPSKPSFAIMGSGGVGGYFGAKLAKSGFETTLVARGTHLQAMQRTGLRVQSADEHFCVQVNVTDNPKDIGPVDFVLFAVKLWDTEIAAQACKPLIGVNTGILSLQNGISSEQTLASILGARHIIGGVAEVSAGIAEPGLIRRISDRALIQFGELDDHHHSARCERLDKALAQAGIQTDHSSDITLAIWSKFVFLTGLSAMTALTRHPIGKVRTPGIEG